MATIEELKQTVEASTEVTQSAIALIGGLATRIEELKTNPDELSALAEQLKQNSAALAEAVSANTQPSA